MAEYVNYEKEEDDKSRLSVADSDEGYELDEIEDDTASNGSKDKELREPVEKPRPNLTNKVKKSKRISRQDSDLYDLPYLPDIDSASSPQAGTQRKEKSDERKTGLNTTQLSTKCLCGSVVVYSIVMSGIVFGAGLYFNSQHEGNIL
jgi:hypothetical protein